MGRGVRPTALVAQGVNVKTISKSRDAVWATAVPELGKRFFVINNLDKASGLINISYTGDPQKFIDCGWVTSYVKNARGERTYNFAGAKAQQIYEVMNSNGLFFIDRTMALEGRVNLIFEETATNQTRVTANTRYVISRQRTVRPMNGYPQTLNDNVTFNTAGSATFPGPSGASTECAATGALERDILAAVN